jgi:hypothetical protein
MMQEARWVAEVAIMNRRFPMFAAFKTENGSVGFFGPIRGRRTGRGYTVIVKVPAQRYPEREPAVYIQPRIMSGYWQMDGVNGDPNGRLSICHIRPWASARNTFANCVLVAIQFLEEFDQ